MIKVSCNYKRIFRGMLSFIQEFNHIIDLFKSNFIIFFCFSSIKVYIDYPESFITPLKLKLQILTELKVIFPLFCHQRGLLFQDEFCLIEYACHLKLLFSSYLFSQTIIKHSGMLHLIKMLDHFFDE